MSRVGWILALAGAGCAPVDVDLYLPFPPATDAQRMVFDVAGADPVVLNPVEPGDFSLRLDVSEGAPAVEVLAYDDTALPVGPLDAAPAEQIGLPLPAPDGVFELEVDGEFASWSEGGPAALTANFRRRLCAPIVSETASWDVPGFPKWAEPIGDDVVFAMREVGQIKMYRTDGGPPVLLDDPFGPREAPWSVWRGANDVVWFGASNGRIYRGRLTRDGIVGISEQYAFTSPFTRISGLDGHIDASGNVELFAASDYGDIVHFDGTEFVEVDEAFERNELLIAWNAPGEAIVVEYETTNAALVRDGRLRRIAGPSEGVHSIASTPTLGAVAGLANGVHATFDQDAWVDLGGAQSAFVLAIHGTEDGFFYLLASGRVGRYYDPQGFCEAQGVLPVLGFRGLLSSLGDELFAIGELNSSEALTQGARLSIGGP